MGRLGACNLKDSLHFPGQLLTGLKLFLLPAQSQKLVKNEFLEIYSPD